MDRAYASSSVSPSYLQSPEVAGPEPALVGKADAENFPVATRLLPRRHRRHLMAVYGFARLVDDVGDEAPPAERAALLDEIESDLDRMYAGQRPRLPVVRTLQPTAETCGIPDDPFRALLAANRRDQRISRYDSYPDLLDYCVLSANPVGRIVLHVFGAATPQRLRLSDRVCSALQVVEHLQDVTEDLARDRVYLPREDLERFGCAETDLAVPASDRMRALIAFEVDRAADLLDAGAPLVGTLRGFARLAVAGYVAGGRAAVAAIRTAAYDVGDGGPRPSVPRTCSEWLRAAVSGR